MLGCQFEFQVDGFLNEVGGYIGTTLLVEWFEGICPKYKVAVANYRTTQRLLKTVACILLTT